VQKNGWYVNKNSNIDKKTDVCIFASVFLFILQKDLGISYCYDNKINKQNIKNLYFNIRDNIKGVFKFKSLK
jgi:hypothetical protein